MLRAAINRTSILVLMATDTTMVTQMSPGSYRALNPNPMHVWSPKFD